jgi:hypothetical protein
VLPGPAIPPGDDRVGRPRDVQETPGDREGEVGEQDREEEPVIVLTVTDDGRGLVAPLGPSLGILGMRERARAAGGSVTVEGPPSGGTTVMARLPLAVGPFSPPEEPA